MPRKRAAGSKPWSDPDDAPELTKELLEHGDLYDGNKLIRRGRPPSASRKQQVTLRLDPDVLEKFRATGPGWQAKINLVLKRHISSKRRLTAE